MPANNHFPENEYFFPAAGDSSRLLVGCRREDYSASRIARAVEDCDAHLLNLNITSMGDAGADSVPEYPVIVDLRVSHRNADSISRSLERYGYTVLDVLNDDNCEGADSLSRQRIDQLIRFLEI